MPHSGGCSTWSSCCQVPARFPLAICLFAERKDNGVVPHLHDAFSYVMCSSNGMSLFSQGFTVAKQHLTNPSFVSQIVPTQCTPAASCVLRFSRGGTTPISGLCIQNKRSRPDSGTALPERDHFSFAPFNDWPALTQCLFQGLGGLTCRLPRAKYGRCDQRIEQCSRSKQTHQTGTETETETETENKQTIKQTNKQTNKRAKPRDAKPNPNRTIKKQNQTLQE